MKESKLEFLARTEGLFVGALSKADMRKFEQLVREGRACRSYEGASGFMGLATVRRVHPEEHPSRAAKSPICEEQ